jgi:hypothetical protein
LSTWTLIQIVFDIFMACGLFVVVMRMNRAPKDDPRLSRGLALLQSKISVLEDLSDRTEQQVSQLVGILESKAREVQAKVELAERHVQEIRVSMDRSLEVAQIFQDKIPHKEIIERQNTIKYVQAARLAHSGLSADEIGSRVDLPRGEIEFIASVNKDRLMFTESELPEWAKTELGPDSPASHAQNAELAAPEVSNEESAHRMRAEIELAENQRLVENLSRLQFEMQNLDMQLARENNSRDNASAYDVPKVETDHLKKLGEEFRKAVREGEVADAKQPFGDLAHNVSQAGRSMLPPLENLAALIPNILEAGLEQAAQAEEARTAPARVAATAAPLASAFAQQAATTQRAAAHPTTTPTAVPAAKDPVLARAVAQAKVQAALRTSARPSNVNRNANTELTQARAVARDLSGKPVPAAKPGEVRKVMFPRIDGSDI